MKTHLRVSHLQLNVKEPFNKIHTPTTSAMTKESALKHALFVLGTNEGENARLTLEQGGFEKVSDLKEITLETLGGRHCARWWLSATTAAAPASTPRHSSRCNEERHC
jgi:hypothetical protein